MATLSEIANAARNEEFVGRIQAAAAVLGLPFHPNQVMHVASRVDLSGGLDAVPDEDILLAITPQDVDPS